MAILYDARDGSFGIVKSYGLERRGSISGRRKLFSLLHSVKTGSGAQSISYSMSTAGCFTGDKEGGA